MKRRQFITLLGGAAATWPRAARAQQPDRIRRLGVLTFFGENDPEGQSRFQALVQGLQQAGWIIGRTIQIDMRWGVNDPDDIRRQTTELLTLTPDVVVAVGALIVAALQRANRSVPIVFVGVVDPVGADLVENLAHPGGNATGFTLFEYGLSGKWLELLKRIAPQITRAAVMRNPAQAAGAGQLGAMQSVAPSLGVELKPVDVEDASEIERAISAMASEGHGGVIVVASTLSRSQRDLIVSLAARYKVPAVYYARNLVASGGLMSYGPDYVEQYRQAAGYVDRILRGEKPADLPVQAPTKYDLTINLKTAKTLGIAVPASLLATADEVIE